jgi:cell division GTPase FtsZ
MATIQGSASPEVNLKMGNAFDETLGDKIRVTVIATGFPSRARLRSALLRSGGKPAPGSRAPVEEPSDAQLLRGLNDSDRWTKPAFMRLKARKIK